MRNGLMIVNDEPEVKQEVVLASFLCLEAVKKYNGSLLH
jgi:hypothetical protein